MAKTTPWLKIKTEYLQGATPKELAEKYNLSAKQVNNKASREKWANEKKEIRIKTHKNTQDEIMRLAHKALDTLESVLEDEEAKCSDKVSACKALLDISGWKTSKQELTGKDGEPLEVKKIFITPEEQKEVKKHIQQMING